MPRPPAAIARARERARARYRERHPEARPRVGRAPADELARDSDAVIAVRYGVDPRTVQNWRKLAGIVRNRRGK